VKGKYCLISPCRDEQDYMRRTLESVINQTRVPDLWVIVDDGSTDDTPQILAEYAEKVDFIKIVRREDRGERKVGPGVIDAFYAGYDTINPDDFEFICKFDLDLDLPLQYFEIIIDRMNANPAIGTCSGKAYYPGTDNKDKSFKGTLISEGCGSEMSVGMIKFYRTECFKDIGGFVREVMWDGIDCHTCRMKGWIACSWDDPEIRFIHLRAMGSSHKSIITGRMRHGFGQWFMGTSLLYMTVSAIFRMSKRPFVIGGLAMWWGYVSSMLKGKKRYENMEFRKHLRRFQMKALLRGKEDAAKTTTVTVSHS